MVYDMLIMDVVIEAEADMTSIFSYRFQALMELDWATHINT